ncbi:MFS transporter [Saccharothrix sp. Mg75]|uniref:MFS transporter n=1 Tax=Saccharothrix sp. Mg75 TaxID=3445357 RepID=UPI003EEF3A3F
MANPRTAPPGRTTAARGGELPLSALTALSTAAFLAILTEALPAGVLPALSRDLSVGEPAAGQALTVYAVATALSAIPLSALTATWRRKPLVLGAVAGFAVANTVTALSSDYALTLVFRFAAGVAAGLVWALLVEYARGMAPPHLQGRAIAVTMAGVPLALSLGIPLGTFLGEVFGWRLAFHLVTATAVLLLGWIALVVPDLPGRGRGTRAPFRQVLARPGVAAVLFVVAAWVLAHNVLYTYVATFLADRGMGDAVDVVLLVFGVASLVSIWVTGAGVDRRLRHLTIASACLVAAAASLLAVLADVPALVHVAAALWGLGWGGVTTLLQTAVTDAGGDEAQALLVTTWNAAMAAGGAVGGVLLDALGPRSFPWSVLALVLPVLLVVVLGRAHAFPPHRPGTAAGPVSAR